MENAKIVLEKKLSQKGSYYFCLSVDFGYRKQMITMDKNLICSLCDVNQSFLYSDLKENEPIVFAEIVPLEL